MKKIIVLIMLSMFSFSSIYAKITWNLSDDGTLTISGTDMPDYVYPEESGIFYHCYDYLPPSDYYDYAPWFSQRHSIKKVIIENGVKNIGSCAFYGCWNLTSVTIPNSVTSIRFGAFFDCI